MSAARTLFKAATLIDGTGEPARLADVLIEGDQIAGIRKASGYESADADESVDCEGLVLAPGFIDVHTHDDALALQAAPLQSPHPKLSQGVCTVITGNCGVSLAPLVGSALPAPLDILPPSAYRFKSFSEYFEALASGSACNVASLVGHTSLRVKHLRELNRPASAAENKAMAAELETALADGAIGLSTGVYYPPARAADFAELCAVAAPLGAAQGVLTMHLRSEADEIDAALREAFAVSRAAQCSLVLSHHKLIGIANHGRSQETLALIDEAARSQAVCLDCYPYTASSTMLIPERIAQSSDVLITWCEKEPSLAGRSLFDVARERKLAPQALAAQLVPAGAIYFAMAEDDVRRILSHPLAMIGSDGLAHEQAPHPRLWGSFARVLGHYSRDEKLFSLETAIYKMTALPARRFGLLAERGTVEINKRADLVLFKPEQVADVASYQNPRRPSAGIARVYVNGQLAARDGLTLHATAGRVLKRSAA